MLSPVALSPSSTTARRLRIGNGNDANWTPSQQGRQLKDRGCVFYL
jgi:hypothetical protein